MSVFSNSSNENPLAAIFLLVFSLFLFSLQDVVIKYFSDSYSVLQIVFIRGLIAGLLLFLAARYLASRAKLKSNRPLVAILRGLFGFTSYTAYYLAVASLPLAEVVAIVFTAPLFVTVMSALFLREQVGLRRWSAVLIGFIGVMIIVGPGGVFDQLGVLLSLTAAITYAIQTIITRFLSQHDSPLTIAFNTTVVFTAASLTMSLFVFFDVLAFSSNHASLAFFQRDWVMPETGALALMIFLGFNGALAFYCMSKAYCVAPASTIAPFEYSYMIWAVGFGYLLWGEVPRATTLIGVVILISSSVYIWYRERSLQRQQKLALLPDASQPATCQSS